MIKKTGKWLKPWHLCTRPRILSESYPMNTNMTGFRWLQKYLHPCYLNIGRVNLLTGNLYKLVPSCFTYDLLSNICSFLLPALKCDIPFTVPNTSSTASRRRYSYGETVTYDCLAGHRFPKAQFGSNTSSVTVACTTSNQSSLVGNWSSFLPPCQSKYAVFNRYATGD